jgi:hypothetical protein
MYVFNLDTYGTWSRAGVVGIATILWEKRDGIQIPTRENIFPRPVFGSSRPPV